MSAERETDGELGKTGFSLVEILISMAVLTLAAEAASVTYVQIFKHSNQFLAKSTLEQQSRYLLDFLVRRVHGIGGGAIRPWSALWVEDNCAARLPFPACDGTDRATLVRLDLTLPECPITGFTAANQLTAPIILGVCCMDAAYNNRQVVLSLGDFFGEYYLSNLDMVACTADITPGQATVGLNNPPPGPSFWTSGTLSPARTSTLYINPLTRELVEFEDLNNNGIMEAIEKTTLDLNVYDMQFAMGYDSNPRDNKISDTQDENDEWLFNKVHINDAFGAGGLTAALPSDLRMVALGVTVGQSTQNAPNFVKILDGPNRSVLGITLNQSFTRLRFRNIGIFLQNG